MATPKPPKPDNTFLSKIGGKTAPSAKLPKSTGSSSFLSKLNAPAPKVQPAPKSTFKAPTSYTVPKSKDGSYSLPFDSTTKTFWTEPKLNDWAKKAGMTPKEAAAFWDKNNGVDLGKAITKGLTAKVGKTIAATGVSTQGLLNQRSSANALLNTINTTSAWTTGFIDKTVQDSQAGKGFNPGAAIDSGNTNANAWTKDQYTKSTSDILVKRFGWDPKSPGTFWAGFAGDVVLDPLNFVPGKALVSVAKGAAKGADAAATAGKLVQIGEESATKAAAKKLDTITPKTIKRNTNEYVKKIQAENVAKTGVELTPEEVSKALTTNEAKLAIAKVKPETSINQATPTRLDLTGYKGAAGAKISNAANKIATDYVYKTTKLTAAELSARTLARQAADTMAAALEAGRKGFMASIVSDRAIRGAEKYVKKDIKNVWAPNLAENITPKNMVQNLLKFEPTVRTKIVEDKATGEFVVQSGNKVELARVPDRAAAEEFVTNYRPGISASELMKRSITDIVPPKQPVEQMTTAEAVKASTGSLGKTVQAILKNVTKEANDAGYSTFETLIAGIRNGDAIGSNNLNKIFEALDPERKIVPQAMRGENITQPDYLKQILVTDEAQNLVDQLTRLEKAADFQSIITAKGISFPEAIAVYTDALRNPGKLSDATQAGLVRAAVSNQKTAQTSTAAAQRFTEASGRSRNLAEDGANTAAAARNLRLDRIQASKEYEQGVSTFGDQTEFSNTAHLEDGSEAVLAENYNSIFESIALARAAGNSRTEWVNQAIKNELAGKPSYNPLNPRQVKNRSLKDHDEFATYMYERTLNTGKALTDLLMSGHIRLSNAKFVSKDDAFLKANDYFGDPARPVKTPHTVYVGVPDILETMKANGFDNLIKEAFFPYATKDAYQKSSFLWQNLTDAVRASLEQVSNGKAINIAEIEARLLYRFEPKLKPTAKRLEEMKVIAAKLAEAIADPRVVDDLKNVHIKRTVGIVNDYITQADGVIGDIANSTRKIWLTALQSGKLTHTKQTAIFRKAFRELLTATNIFKIDAGPVAESIARSYAATFMRGTDKAMNEVMDQAVKLELEQFTKEFTKLYNEQKAIDAADLGARANKPAGVVAREKLEKRLTIQETRYETHMGKREDAFKKGLETSQKWAQKQQEILQKLHTVRLSAAAKGVEARNWSALENQWIPAEKYDAIQEAEDIANSFTLPFAADIQAPYATIQKAANPKQQALINEAALQKQTGIVEDVADEASALLESGAFKTEGRSEIAEVVRAVEHAEVEPLLRATAMPEVRIHTVAGDYTTNANKGYNPMLTAEQREAGFERTGKIQSFIDRWGGVYGTGFDQMHHMNVHANTSHDVSAQFATVLRSTAQKWAGVSDKVFASVWDGIKKGKDTLRSTNPAVQGLFTDLKRITDLIFGDNVNNEMILNGFKLDDVIVELNRLGLNPGNGFPTAVTVKNMTMQQFAEALPLGNVPKNLDKGTMGRTEWLKNKEAYKKAEFNDFLVLSNIAHAFSQAKFKKGMMDDFFVRNDYRFYELTREEALQQGFIKPRLIGDLQKTDGTYASYIPDDALVLPDAWESFGGVIREANAIYNRAQDPKWLRGMMRLNGIIKENQTILVPGHALTNAIGDNAIALNMGVTNPTWWGTGVRLANTSAFERATGEWFGKVEAPEGSSFLQKTKSAVTAATSKLYNDPLNPAGRGITRLEMEFRQLGESVKGKSRGFEGTDATVHPEGDLWVVKNANGDIIERTTTKEAAQKVAQERGNKTTGIIVYKNGKPTRVNFSDQDMINMFRQNGIIITNQISNDVQGLVDYLDTAKQDTKQGSFMRKAGAKIGLSYRTITKAPADMLAWQGNIPRVAHALKVIQSRSWASVDDAMAAAARTVHKYHPTINSLRSAERKYARAIIGYYTWIKTAHLTTLDMALTHPSLLTVPSKAQQNYAKSQGFHPQSIGQSYGAPQAVAPWLAKSPTGMLVGDQTNPFIVKLPFMQTQVLNTFNFTWDYTNNVDQNLWNNIAYGAQTLGKMVGPVQKRTAEVLWRIDPDTGLPSAVKDSRTAFDAIASDFSVFNLLKGLGLYTPAKKDPTLGKTPLTTTDQQIAETNWWTRIGLEQLYSPGNIKGANLEQAKRNKFLEQFQGNQK